MMTRFFSFKKKFNLMISQRRFILNIKYFHFYSIFIFQTLLRLFRFVLCAEIEIYLFLFSILLFLLISFHLLVGLFLHFSTSSASYSCCVKKNLFGSAEKKIVKKSHRRLEESFSRNSEKWKSIEDFLVLV